ncbi:MAG TPA: phytanoyl-CoA dioxygenase family protein [Chthonomonadaceae bacterium]|nr:phytanoyl-CoA dioxygenase family protein [Chthonomonadaceae bacterium]
MESSIQEPHPPLLPSDADVCFYRENGYWLAPRILSGEELETLRDHYTRVVDGVYETGRTPWSRHPPLGEPVNRIVKIDNTYWTDATLAWLACHPLLGAMAARLAGASAIRLWHDQLLFKPPDSGEAGNVGWHQDYHYWQCTDPPNLLTAWVALDDVDEENGCMQMAPGSHRWGLLSEGDFLNKDLYGLRQRIEAVHGQPFETVFCKLPAGAVSFHHCLTVHGSGPNRSQRPRRSLVVHLMPEGTKYRANTPSEGHMNVRLFHGQEGDCFAGPYFPVLFREGVMENPWQVVTLP